MIAFFLATPAVARDPILRQPIDCTLGETCFIQNYVDTDPGRGAADFLCQGLSYDGHKGTDFALTSLEQMRRGVAVLAAAPGVVRGLRDGEADISQASPNAPDISGKECGNGMVIAHGDGWETQYCHMKQGSIRVVSGQRVGAGTPLGEVGLSGHTEFPHVHFSLRRDGAVIDPFNPQGVIACDLPAPTSLWDEGIAYEAGGLIAIGTSDALPEYETIKSGQADHPRLSTDAPALVLWAYAYGARAGDMLRFALSGPDGVLVAKDVSIEKNQAQLFRAVGKRGTNWPAGTYSGTVTLQRDSIAIDKQDVTLTLTD